MVKNHQKYLSRCLFQEVSFADIFKMILIMGTKQLILKKVFLADFVIMGVAAYSSYESVHKRMLTILYMYRSFLQSLSKYLSSPYLAFKNKDFNLLIQLSTPNYLPFAFAKQM